MAEVYKLLEDVRRWGDEREISNPYTQMVKVTEEVGEIAHEISRGNFDTSEVIDALGDTTVTVAILAHILGYNLEDCLEAAYVEICERKGHVVNGGFVKDED